MPLVSKRGSKTSFSPIRNNKKAIFIINRIFSFDKSRIVPKTLSSPLCSQNVSFLVKIEGGFDENKLEKSRMEKTPVFEKNSKKLQKMRSSNSLIVPKNPK